MTHELTERYTIMSNNKTIHVEELASAIILQAVKDYRKAKHCLAKANPKLNNMYRALDDMQNKNHAGDEPNIAQLELEKDISKIKLKISKAEDRVQEIERFFLSEWFGQLSRLDGMSLLKRLRGEYL